MEENIMVSVVCNAFNHGKFIAQTLDSFLMQKTDFAFEVLIHDDASTDNTAQIIREYAAQHPDIIKPYYQTENQYSQHIPITTTYQYPRVKGKYIAWCEGDDYWTDPLKLQKQVDAMEQNPQIDMCAHRAQVMQNGKIVRQVPECTERKVYTTEEVIRNGGAFVATNSLLYRRSFLESENNYTRVYSLDYILQISGSLRGGMLYLPDAMCAYRFMEAGSWSATTAKDAPRRKRLQTRLEGALQAIDEGTQYRFTKEIQSVISRAELKMLAKEGNLKQILSKDGRVALGKQTVPMRLKILLYACYKAVFK